jgi:hypothetical protein
MMTVPRPASPLGHDEQVVAAVRAALRRRLPALPVWLLDDLTTDVVVAVLVPDLLGLPRQ